MSLDLDAETALRLELLAFVDGVDRSRAAGQRIEAILAERFTGDQRFEDLEYALALYAPFGGDNAFLIQGDELAAECRSALALITSAGPA